VISQDDPMHDMREPRQCGARARTRGGAPCRNPAMPNGRCRMHGGMSTGPRVPRTKHGAYGGDFQRLLEDARRLLRAVDAVLEPGGRLHPQTWKRSADR
jgi:hypothetical protein